VIAHEYGHHGRRKPPEPPWDAIDWGPKRWASSMQVCARTKKGELSPGAEDPVRYEQNPGEGWGEAYRVLNQRKLGLPESPWQIVTQALYPTAAALTAAEQERDDAVADRRHHAANRLGDRHVEDAEPTRCPRHSTGR